MDMKSSLFSKSILEYGSGSLFVNKPEGVSVHNQPGKDLCSLAEEFIRTNAEIRENTNFDPDFGVNPVHRLDKETSGVMLLAVNREMFHYFSKEFENRAVIKQYIALLHGNLQNQGADGSGGTWNWPLSKAAGGRKKPAGAAKRQPCETRYCDVGHSEHYTMVAVEIISGRTHQIRRHAKLSGHPVVGDNRYGSIRALNYLKNNRNFLRLALHAHSITVSMAPGRKPRTVKTPEVPASMMMLFNDDSLALELVDPRSPVIVRMIAELDEYQASLYPPESNHLVDIDNLAGKDYYFIAAMDHGEPKAVASFKRTSHGYVEIKRLYVIEEYRGRKLAIKLMAALEKKARLEGFTNAKLETGIHQQAAIALYEKLGYDKTGPFGSYAKDPLSVFMSKNL
jgi:23S rRNA-/tRNA-specific pseudouridylate synthase/GNAT superfamily N-acetyltransferase